MKHFLWLLVFLCCTFPAHTNAQLFNTKPDTVLEAQLHEVDIMSERKWANDTLRYRYNQMRYYVTTILPYLKVATRLFNDINTQLESGHLSKKEKRRFINAKEDAMRSDFEDKVRDLNVTQGILLIKLIERQTGANIYKTLQEFKNPLTALKWQTWARFNGLNLNDHYHPEKEPDLEHIMKGLGYPLPAFYSAADPIAKD